MTQQIKYPTGSKPAGFVAPAYRDKPKTANVPHPIEQDGEILITAPKLYFIMPFPPLALSPNGRAHHHAKASATADYRQHAYVVALGAIGRGARPKVDKARTQIIAYRGRRNRRDRDNIAASVKALWDGVTDAQVWADDSGVTHLPVVLAYDKQNPRLEILIDWIDW